MKHIFLLLSFYSILYLSLNAQPRAINRSKFRIHINHVNEAIKIDGVLDEAIWQTAEKAEKFYRVLPIDTGMASAPTEVMMCYDESNIYMAIICYDTLPGRRPAESLRRDFTFGKNDNFLVFIDTYNDQTNGFSFGISAAGAQWDGLQSNGGTVGLEWDTKWKSEVQNYPDKWVAEFAIPFRSIRYNLGSTEWGINFSRLDLKRNEKSSWAPMPRQLPTASLAYTGSLVWDKPVENSGLRFSLIPYVSGKMVHDKEAGTDPRYNTTMGMDAKISLSTALNLDMTVNPDFSQVEVDRQRTNIERFELFFPEKRQFFLENSDLFASLGRDNIRPFFSRRIGLTSPVQAGLRLSGNIGDKWRIGVLNMQTGKKDSIQGNNFTTIALQRKVFKRSNLTAFLVNKQLTGEIIDTSAYKYNRVAGLDFNLASLDNRWTGKFFYHQSFSPEAGNDAFSSSASLVRETQTFLVSLIQSWVGTDYRAETGFVPRKGYYQLNPTIQYKFYPKSTRIANHGANLKMDMYFDNQFATTDREIPFTYFIEWLNKNRIAAEIRNVFVQLRFPFDPTNSGGIKLDSMSSYNWNEAAVNFLSDTRRLFNVDLTARYGGFYNGNKLTFSGDLFYRIQPYASIAASFSYNNIKLPEPYSSAELVLIGPRLDITFSNKIFLTTLAQYNNQIDNFNINVRFQWRYAPVSDIYLVYTENAFPADFKTKNRGIVLKISYWLN
ncbi:MAG: DUF5916 domain-containing protein [Bacteroidales bacterium]